MLSTNSVINEIAADGKANKSTKIYRMHLGLPFNVSANVRVWLALPRIPTTRSFMESNIIRKYEPFRRSCGDFQYAIITKLFRNIPEIVSRTFNTKPTA
jgi:hypothetical protein